MTTETINGLHKCQPKNEPKQGDTKNLVVLHMPANGEKKAWIKIKSESLEKGGLPYRIVSVTPTGWKPDTYGNLAFNLEIEAVNGKPRDDEKRVYALPPATGEVEWIKLPPDKAETKRFSMLDERQRAIIRQHSQSMALEVLKLKVTLNELTVEDLTPAKLRTLADYFDNDVIGAAR